MEKYQIDFEKWSEESKRSFRYTGLNGYVDYYSDIHYECVACGKKAVFSAKDQKISYEINKNYIWQKRVLCPSCYQELQEIKQALVKYEELLSAGNIEILNENLALLSKLPRYGRKINKAMENRIKLLQRNRKVRGD